MDYIYDIWGDGKLEYDGYFRICIDRFIGERWLGERCLYIKTNISLYELKKILTQDALNYLFNFKNNVRVVISKKIIIEKENLKNEFNYKRAIFKSQHGFNDI